MTDGKRPEGRPPLHPYQETYPDKLREWMAEGALDCNICTRWHISRNTFYRWLREKPELNEAHEEGLMACEAWWVEWGMKGMQGTIKGFSFNAWIAFMNNKFKWAKNALTDPSNITNNNITIGNMNVLNQLPRQDLIDKIKLLGNKHQDTLDVQYTELNEQDNQSK